GKPSRWEHRDARPLAVSGQGLSCERQSRHGSRRKKWKTGLEYRDRSRLQQLQWTADRERKTDRGTRQLRTLSRREMLSERIRRDDRQAALALLHNRDNRQ